MQASLSLINDCTLENVYSRMFGSWLLSIQSHVATCTYIIIIIIIIICLLFVIQFYPFGLAQNDSTLPNIYSDTRSSSAIHLSETFLFYNENLTNVYVSYIIGLQHQQPHCQKYYEHSFLYRLMIMELSVSIILIMFVLLYHYH